MGNCVICNEENCDVEKEDYDSVLNVKCKRCGCYRVTIFDISRINLTDKTNKAKISHFIRSHQRDTPFHLTFRILEDISKNFKLPKPREQANNLIIWLGEKLTRPVEQASIKATHLAAIIGAVEEIDVHYVTKNLKAEELISGEKIGSGQILADYKFGLTFKGWDRYYELQHTNKNSKLAFMAMAFNTEPINGIFEKIIKQVVNDAGFEIRKLDEEKRAGSIDDKLRVEIRRSKFLIADLTNENRGAYWEAGFAEGLGIPVIYICEEKKFENPGTHFDTNHHLTVKWQNDAEGLKTFAEELKATIRATLPGEAKMED